MVHRVLTVLVLMAGAIAAAIAVFVLVLWDRGHDDLAIGVEFHPFTSSPGSGTCVAVVDPALGPPNSCDPVNLLFLDMELAEVTDALSSGGWTDIGLGSTQWLFFETNRILQPHNRQLFRLDGVDQRFHMRLWATLDEEGRTVVIGAVHHERGFTNHSIDRDWEAAEDRIVTDICGGGRLKCP